MEQSFAVNAEVLESAWDGAEGRWRLVVRVRFQNRGAEVFELDKTTAGAGGRLRNSVFAVVADGAEVDYQGMMAKRAHPGPDGFFRIPPGGEQVIEVDVGQYYPVPEKAKSVTVQFDHFNHFSVDRVQLTSNVVAVSLAK